MGRAAKLKQTRKIQQEIDPNQSEILANLQSTQLQQWILQQWSGLLNVYLTKDKSKLKKLAKAMTNKLAQMYQPNLKQDLTVKHVGKFIELAVGINMYTKSVWVFAADNETGFQFCTEDHQEYPLTNNTK